MLRPCSTVIRCIIIGIVTFLLIRPAHAEMDLSVSVKGVDGDIRENVLALLSIEQQKDHKDLTEGLMRRLHEKAPDEIRRALQPFGYYRPGIEAALEQENGTWKASYIISPGSPVMIEHLEILISGEGRDHKRIEGIREAISINKGDVLNHQHYEKAVRLFHDTAVSAGFLKARMIKSGAEVHVDGESADMFFHFETGPRFRFGKVTFIQDVFSQEFLDRFVPFKKGKPYDVSAILDLQNALNNSDYFESVHILPRVDQADDLEVPVEVRLVPRKKYKYRFGLGYGTDTGLRGITGWEISRINKEGHRFGVTLKASEIKSGVTAEYTIPLRDPRTDSLVFTGGTLREETDTSLSEKIFGGARFDHVRNSWKESIYLNYEEEEFDVGDDKGRSTLLMPGTGWTRTWADNPIHANRGLRIYLDVRGAHESLLSDTSFLQFRSHLKYIRGLWKDGRVLLRGEAGASMVNEFEELPVSVRFFAGGDHSVRGYTYNSLGPEDNDGNVVGGRHLLVGSIEYEHTIWKEWSAAIFYDAGNAIDSLSDSFRTGTGFGIRWKSPVGPVRVDLAFPLSESDRDWRLHLVVGPDL